MSDIIRAGEGDSPLARMSQPTRRRDFLKWTGAGAAAILVGGACSTDNTRTIVEAGGGTGGTPTGPAVTINAANDFGILNFAFALEQLEAAFYTQVVATPFAGITTQESRILTDIRDHEVIHREFLRAAITALAPAGTLIGNLTPNFNAVNFASRDSVLNTARTFEDLGVAAYNGSAQFVQSGDILGIAGKIVSVEARHASAIRDLLMPRSNAYAPAALDDAFAPSRVLAAAKPFIANAITVTNAPTGF